MNPTKNTQDKSSVGKKDSEGALEKIANAIDPAGTQVSDEEIMDPGAKRHESPPTRNTPSTHTSRPH